MENNDEVFESYANMGSEDIKMLIKNKINLLGDKLSGKINDGEKSNPGYLFWNCKMILKNVYMSCDKLINKYSDMLSNDELLYYKNMSEIIKNDIDNCNSIDDINRIYNSLEKHESQNMIGKISINGIKLNDIATQDMKNLLLDSRIPYEYNHVLFSIDDNDKITKIVFYSKSSKDYKYGIMDVQIECEKDRLTTVSDFNRVLGIGKEEIDEKNPLYKYIEYTEGDYRLKLTIYDNQIINVEINK